MRVVCVICSDSFISFNDVSAIPCGHTFHTHCILQWIEKSKSCPSCRNKASIKNVQKLFFDTNEADSSQVDTDSLKNQIDSLKFQLIEKKQILRNANDANEKLENQNKGLKNECVNLERLAKESEMKLFAYKEQVKHMESVIKNASKSEEEAREAKSQLKLYKMIKTLLDENSADIENTISSNICGSNQQESIKNLSTMSCVLQSRNNELKTEKRKCVEQKEKILVELKATKKNLSKSEDRLRELEKETSLQQEDIQSLERENNSLRKKIEKLQDAIDSPSADLKNGIIRRFISESPAPNELKRCAETEIQELDLTPEVTRKVPKTQPCSKSTLTTVTIPTTHSSTDSSPYLRLKSASITSLNRPLRKFVSSSSTSSFRANNFNIMNINKSSSSKCNTFSKKLSASAIPVYPSDDFGYDGLGGHHKVDYFPDPNRAKVVPKIKKAENNGKVSSHKTSFQIPPKTLKDFFKDPFGDI